METGGLLYGVGLGPGDPELVTVKALRILRGCDVLVLPDGRKERGQVFPVRRADMDRVNLRIFGNLPPVGDPAAAEQLGRRGGRLGVRRGDMCHTRPDQKAVCVKGERPVSERVNLPDHSEPDDSDPQLTHFLLLKGRFAPEGAQ